ncbi:MAG: thymidine phosphorylase family protein [Gammaproteobacteria bacterium]|nr:thymidine phosphorylase family protein [Gammaproteobacteria bacterium]MBU0786543.1 thymidine phosphorylase family protein [Gammaproteobacteria bacterium]MBU0817151.1 thymidine phosphorylase family protein [Gammaproteobacteria bacterium]MBU1787728.1 thymidine phosphorylase family protein [Gammaproteobacteria bacterium]
MKDHELRLRALGIDTRREHVIYMRRDCHVCRSEGFEAQARVAVNLGDQSIIATLNVVNSELLAIGEASLSTGAWRALGAAQGDRITVLHAPTLDSLSAMRSKIYGHRLDARAFNAIIGDVASGRYSDLHIAAFLSACAGGRMSLEETIDLTRAMVDVGDRIDWGGVTVADKHCVGGLPGNRTTPIVVAIVAAAGLIMPKTSSRAITSPAGTADVMETLTRVDLDVPAMRRVVDREGGCFVWGGAMPLSPADDVLIRVERPLDLDSDAQLVASVLSKKIAAGATHAVIDIPVGPTAKVRSEEDAHRLQNLLEQVAQANGLKLRVLRTRGSQPVGRGIGPALEAHDVLAVLRGAAAAPVDLRMRSLVLAGELLEFCGHSIPGKGRSEATRLLDSGIAWEKFQSICEAQGGMRVPGIAPIREPVITEHSGFVSDIDSRRLARVAKLVGAPGALTAGLQLHVKLGDSVQRGSPLFTLHAETTGELAYAKHYLATHPFVTLGEAVAT